MLGDYLTELSDEIKSLESSVEDNLKRKGKEVVKFFQEYHPLLTQTVNVIEKIISYNSSIRLDRPEVLEIIRDLSKILETLGVKVSGIEINSIMTYKEVFQRELEVQLRVNNKYIVTITTRYNVKYPETHSVSVKVERWGSSNQKIKIHYYFKDTYMSPAIIMPQVGLEKNIHLLDNEDIKTLGNLMNYEIFRVALASLMVPALIVREALQKFEEKTKKEVNFQELIQYLKGMRDYII